MNKRWTPILIAVVIIVLGGAIWAALDHKNQSPAQTNGTNTTAQKSACELFTLNDAQKIIGGNARAFGSSLGGQFTTKDLVLTTCPYSNAAGDASTAAISQTITLQVKYARTNTGKNANQSGFDALKTAADVPVTGLGNEAFYIPSTGLLQVLEGNYWLTSSSSNIGGSQLTHNQVQAQQVAADALAKL